MRCSDFPRSIRLLPAVVLAALAGCARSDPAAEAPLAAPPGGTGAVAISRHFDPASRRRSLEVVSQTYRVDRIYKSMQGPQSSVAFTLDDGEPGQYVWVTGYRAEVVGEDGVTPVSQEYMCHSNLDSKHTFPSLAQTRYPRLFTLSQGQQQIAFPEGFGLPLFSDERLELWTQVLNLNPVERPFGLKQKVTIDYLRPDELERPLVPLMMSYVQVLVSLVGSQEQVDPGLVFAGPAIQCAVGQHALGGRSDGVMRDEEGNGFSLHWVVEPGRHEYRRTLHGLPLVHSDTTLHYIAVHLHPFAESLELRDATEDRSIWQARAVNRGDRIGLAEVDHFSSAEGIPLAHDHQYEVVSVYNNTSRQPQDSMAVMFLYCRDQRFEDDTAARAREYLRQRKEQPLSPSLAEILADRAFRPQPTQPHPLVGRPAPDFTLVNHLMQPVSLAELVAEGPLVLVFYFGYYCDHCVAQLYGLDEDLRLFRELGARVAAVSGDPPALTRRQFQRFGAFRFPVLFDNNTAAAGYGVLVEQALDLQPQLLHGTFLIDRGGKVVWANTGSEPFFDNRTLLVELARLTGRTPQVSSGPNADGAEHPTAAQAPREAGQSPAASSGRHEATSRPAGE